MPTLGCSCSPRSANSKRSQCRGMGCVKAIALLEPGPSFCWGPALEGPTSPSSTRSSTPGKVDEIDTPGAPPVRTPLPASSSAAPPAPRTDPAALHRPRFACTPRNRLISIVRSCAQELNFALLPRPELRVARQGDGDPVAGQWQRHGPCGPCGCSGAQGTVKGWVLRRLAKAAGFMGQSRPSDIFLELVTCSFCVRHFSCLEIVF